MGNEVFSDGRWHEDQTAANRYSQMQGQSSGGSFETSVGGAAGAGIMWIFGLLAIGVFVATNILYAIVIGGIFIVGRTINRGLKRVGVPLLLRLPIKLVTFVLVLGAMIWALWDKQMGMVPVLRNDAIVKEAGTVYGRLFPLNDDNTINFQAATLTPGEQITILRVNRNGNTFKIKTSSDIEGYVMGRNIENAYDYSFHKQRFWDRMMEFSFSPKERPLVPGRYEAAGTDMVLILEKAKNKHFDTYIPGENSVHRQGIKANLRMIYNDELGGISLYFDDYKENKTPLIYKNGLYNFSITLEPSSEAKKNSAEFAPYRRFTGDYIITSSTSFARDGIEWNLTEQVDNSLF